MTTTTPDNMTSAHGFHTDDLRVRDIKEQLEELRAKCLAGCQEGQTFEEFWQCRTEWLEDMERLYDRWDAIEADLDDPYREDPVGYVPQTWWKAKNARQIELRRIWAAMKTGTV